MRLILRLLSIMMTICTCLFHTGIPTPAPQDGAALMYIHTDKGLLVCLTGTEPADRWALTLTLTGNVADTAALTPAPGITLTRLTEDGSRVLLEGTRCEGEILPLLYVRPERELTLAPPADAPYIYYRKIDPDMTVPIITSAPLVGITLSFSP